MKETQITKDKNCESRKIFWSSKTWFGGGREPHLDGRSILAVSLSNGKVFIFDIELSIIKRLDPEISSNSNSKYSKSVAAVVFPELKMGESAPRPNARPGLRYCCVIYRNGNYTIYRIDAKVNVLTVCTGRVAKLKMKISKIFLEFIRIF